MSPGPNAASKMPDGHNLDRRLLSGFAWTAAARWGSQCVSWGSLLLLARMLSPEDFGIYGMTSLFVSLVSTVSEFGIDSSIIASKDLTPVKIRQMHTVSVLLGVAGSVIALLAAAPLAVFFRTPVLKSVVPAMGLMFAIVGFRIVPQSLLLKELRFKAVSGAETANAVVQAAAALVFAWLGFRYWALVIGNLSGVAVMVILFCAIRPCGFSVPSLGEIRKELVFSQKVLVGRLAWFAYSNADFAVAGRRLGRAALGTYTMAWSIGNMPLDKLTTLVTRVTPSFLAKVQDDKDELRRYLRILVEGVSLITFPVAIGLALIADALMAGVFDPRWRGVAAPLRILALSVVLRSLSPLMTQVLYFGNDVSFAMWQTIAMAIVLPPSFWYAAQWGSVGIAMVWLCLVCPLLAGTVFARAMHNARMSFGEFCRAIGPAALASAAMAGVVLAMAWLMSGRAPLAKLIAESTTGAAVYAALLLIFYRTRLALLYQLLVGRKAEQGATAA